MENEAVDFLLITSIPNVFSPSYNFSEQRVINFSGLHGAGMRAIDLVLENEFLEQLHNKIYSAGNRSRGWQALIKVAVDKLNQVPVRILDWRVFEIDGVDFDAVYKNMPRRPRGFRSIEI